MKRKLFSLVITIALGCFIAKSHSTAASNPYGEPYPIEVTAYCDHGITKSGIPVRVGICAGREEWIGKTAIIYQSDGQLLGIYEILDTGGDYRIKAGKCLDIFMPDKAQCKEFGRQQCRVQIVDAEG